MQTAYRSLLAVLFLLFACSTPPRTTTQPERDGATIFLNSSKTALLAIHQANPQKLPAEKLELALSQLTRLQARVDESETKPISWLVLLSDLQTFATEWALKPPPAALEPK